MSPVQSRSESLPLGELLLCTAAADGDRDAVVFPDERLTYGELADRAQTIARGLIALGVAPGAHVGVLMANSPECIATLFGISLAGAVIVPVNTRYRAVELAHVLADAELVAILTSDRIDNHVDLVALVTEVLDDELEAALLLRDVVVFGSRRAPATLPE